MPNQEEILKKLKAQKFRASFHLKEKDINYYHKNGDKKIKEHAYDFITRRLAPSNILNDGKQTPMRGHPVFIAQHATATCCRTCLSKWYKIDANRELAKEEIDYIVNLIMKWIINEVESREDI